MLKVESNWLDRIRQDWSTDFLNLVFSIVFFSGKQTYICLSIHNTLFCNLFVYNADMLKSNTFFFLIMLILHYKM